MAKLHKNFNEKPSTVLCKCLLLLIVRHQLLLLLFGNSILAVIREERSLFSSKFHVASNEALLVVSITSYFRKVVQYCSGTVISDRLVLTAAHCLYRKDSGFADQIRVRSEGWTLYAPEYIIRADFVFLPIERAICADMALVFLPIQVPGFLNHPFATKFAKLDPKELFREGEDAEIFALGYGITELNRISLLPRKVPMKMMAALSECTLNFYFSQSAISCSGDSGGPVFFYPKNGSGDSANPLLRAPVYLGLSSQIAIYDVADFEDSHWNDGRRRHSLPKSSPGAIDDCKRAKELNVLQTYHIQGWLQTLVQREKDENRRKLFKDAISSLVGE